MGAAVIEERKVTGWAARDASGILSPYTYTLRCNDVALPCTLSPSLSLGVPPTSVCLLCLLEILGVGHGVLPSLSLLLFIFELSVHPSI